MQKRIRTLMSITVWSTLCLSWQVSRANSGVTANDYSSDNISVFSAPFYAGKEKDTLTNQAAIVNDSTKERVASKKKPTAKSSCTRNSCSLYVEVDKSAQMMDVYLSGALQYSFPVSTGRPGHPTPDLDLRPQGPLYEKYTSTKYPEGDYEGLGNMPYAVFLKNGYAIHGTTTGSIRKLGTQASHGCVRLHPDDARTFFELVKTVGLSNTWVTVH